MKMTAIKPVLFSSILGLAMSTAIAATTANAAESILNDAIHDYSDDAWGNFEDTATYNRGAYHTSNLTDTLLDESYHDYVSQDVAQFNNTSAETEQADFAAFEEVKTKTSVPWVISSKRSW